MGSFECEVGSIFGPFLHVLNSSSREAKSKAKCEPIACTFHYDTKRRIFKCKTTQIIKIVFALCMHKKLKMHHNFIICSP